MTPDTWPHWVQHLILASILLMLVIIGLVLLGAFLLVLWGSKLIVSGWLGH